VVGIDFDTHAVHLVRLDENEPEAHYFQARGDGNLAWDRALKIRGQMPAASWWDDVYLVAVESPKSNRFDTAVKLACVQGIAVACVPDGIEVWQVTPHDWKGYLSIGLGVKPGPDDFAPTFMPWRLSYPVWPQDALDALGIALYARDVNAKAIETQLAQ